MLELCKLLLTSLNLWPLATSTSMQTFSVLRYVMYLSILVMFMIGTFKYALEHMDDIDEATEPAFASFAFSTSMFIYIYMISQRRTISSAIEQLETYVDRRIKNNRKQSESNDISNSVNVYEEAEKQYTNLSRRYIKFCIGIICFYAIVLLLVPLTDILYKQMDANNWSTLFKLAYPINEHKISSFFVHYILDFAACYVHFYIYSASSAFHMATTRYVSAFVSEIISILQRCDTFISNNKLTAALREYNVKMSLNEAVSIYADILTLMHALVKVMSGILFIIIVNTIIFMAVGLFQMETKSKAGAFEVYVSLNSVGLQIALIWFFCYHSTLVPIRLNQVSHAVYSLDWYRFSIRSQKCVAMIIRQANKHFAYRGFGLVQCDMQTLSMMVNSVISYYLLLKKI